MAKSNIRSMRFSDTILEMIEQQTGDTFTQKFENLVTRCMWELPEKERQLKITQDAIKEERERLTELCKKVQSWKYTADRVTKQLEQLKNALDVELKQYSKP